jgi:hypothetical protein
VSDEAFALKFITPGTDLGVFLDRCEDVGNPAYIVCGKTKCYRCDRWCWLGSETLRVVSSGHAVPFCLPCGAQAFPQGAKPPVFVDVVQDRR